MKPPRLARERAETCTRTRWFSSASLVDEEGLVPGAVPAGDLDGARRNAEMPGDEPPNRFVGGVVDGSGRCANHETTVPITSDLVAAGARDHPDLESDGVG